MDLNGVVAVVQDGTPILGIFHGNDFVWPDPWEDTWSEVSGQFWDSVWRDAWTLSTAAE
jgi:hypothetical protein